MCSKSNECDLRKKLLEIHDHDCATFEMDSVLGMIEAILNLVTSGIDGSPIGLITEPEASEIRSLSETLHKISCVFNCKCSGGDAAMEILQLLSRYEWEAKFAIVLASFVVDYAEFSHAIKLYKDNNNRVGELVAIFKKIPVDIDEYFVYQLKSNFEPIIKQSIEAIRSIVKFRSLQCKYISNDAEPMASALNRIPIDVYSLTQVVYACTSQLRKILGNTTTDERKLVLSPAIWFVQRLELITRTSTYFEHKFEDCSKRNDENKLNKYMDKLKRKFNQTTLDKDNQKILKLMINTKGPNSHPLESSLDEVTKVGLDDLRGKTVLLFFSDLDVPEYAIFMLNRFYEESRLTQKQQYEIVWLPTEENIEKNETLKQKFEGWKSVMKWYCLQSPSLLKPGVVNYMETVLHYSKKNPILVALDQRGKMVNSNAFNMVWKWGNAAYPFTKRCELDLCSRMKWSLQLLVDGIDQNLSNWMKEDKIICLYGGKDEEWIEKFVKRARQVQSYDADNIKLEMMYVGEETSEEVTEILKRERSLSLAPECSWYLLKRIESMMACANEETNFVVEMDNMHRLGHSNSWALISQGAGYGADEIARGLGDEMFRGLQEFESWTADHANGRFVMALKGHVAAWPLIPQPDFCTVCHRSMYGCYTK